MKPIEANEIKVKGGAILLVASRQIDRMKKEIVGAQLTQEKRFLLQVIRPYQKKRIESDLTRLTGRSVDQDKCRTNQKKRIGSG